jgi:methyl coenzyme M reductase subunit C
VDFTYLDLVLERGLEPEQAVAQTRRLVLFAGAGVPEGAAIPATDLKISQP